MKFSLHPIVLRVPFVFGFLIALCLGLAGCDSSPPASGYTLLTTAKPDAGRMPETVVARPYSGLHQPLDSPSGSLRQFSAKGHVLGFDVGSVLVASGNHALKVEFVNANPIAPQSVPSSGDSKDNKAPALSEVRYPGLWQGIDLSYKAEPNGIAETVWKVEPGADISQARLRYNRPLTLNPDGSLNIRYPIGNLTESAPIAWQEKNGQRKPVTVAFALNSEQELGFKLGSHDPALPVWIDPTLSWNTFLGGNGLYGDFGIAIAVDGSGNIYVTGKSNNSWGSPLRAFAAVGTTSSNAFVAKLDSNGNLLWNTFLGGAGNDEGNAIAVDGSGNAYVVGNSLPPITGVAWGNPIRAFSGRFDAFVAKLDSNGNLVWNTFLGGAGTDYGLAIAVDGNGNAYAAGDSLITWGNPLRAFGGSLAFTGDAFAAKLDSNTGKLVWNTFLGGTGGDSGDAIAVDGSGNAYVAGPSSATWGNPLRAYVNAQDAFVAKLNSLGQLVWNTFLGGAGDDGGGAIAIDGNGNAYVAGRSYTTWGNPQRVFGGSEDAFAAKLDSNTGKLVWNTFLGGEGRDFGDAIRVDSSGKVYVVGTTVYASWGNPQRAYSPGNGEAFTSGDAFTAILDSTGQLVWNTFLGGAGDENGRAIAVDGSGNAYVAGYSLISWGSPLRAYSGGLGDAFVVRLAGDIVNKANQTITFGPVPTVRVGSTATISATGGASGNPVIFTSLTPTVCTVSGINGSTVTGVATSICAIAANQAGNTDYNAAPQIVQPFSVSQGSQANASINCLFNWAEQNYAGLFAPSGTVTAVSGDSTYRYYSSTNAYLRVSSANRHVSYQLAGGASQDVGPLNDWLPVAGCPIPPPQTECLFNWAETNYPGLFAPSGFATAVWDVYTYRYYSATKAYLGVSSVDDHVYYLGQDGAMLDEGPTSYWFPLAGCQ